MEQLKQWAARLRAIVCSRVFAGVVLACLTVGMAAMVSVRSRAVTVTDGTESRVVLTMQEDPYRALAAAGFSLDTYDELDVDFDAGTIDINRAMTVSVKADGLSTMLYMTEGTVADALRQADVTVGNYDRVTPALTQPITDGTAVAVDRVQYQDYTVTERIAFNTVTKYSCTLAPGKSKVSQSGAYGVKTITYRKTIVNGQVVETSKVSEAVTRQPVSRIILQGTKLGTPHSKAPFSIQLDDAGQPVKYKKVISGIAKAYTARNGKHTSTGRVASVGVVAVNPKVIPYGSKLWITSPNGSVVYGYAVAGDTGGGLMRNSFLVDCFFDTEAECRAWGNKKVNVYILE